MRNFLIGILLGLILVVAGYYAKRMTQQYIADHAIVSPISKILEKPLEKYTILRLSGRVFNGGQIVLDGATATTSAYTVYTFHYTSDGKKVTGLAHIPRDASEANKKPVIVQFRGYIDATRYFSGAGTQHSAEVYAQHGFISLAPDFLGYGGSDKPSTDVFEERFETYTAALNLLASVHTLPVADAARVGIWGHSNGGQIALTALEASQRVYPAVLWAPVSKPFPYSILYYTDDADDHGKALRRELAAFEHEYDVEQYSLTNYLDRIAGPLQIHQGSADEAVPQTWTETFVEALQQKGPEGKRREDQNLQYFVYPGADHDMNGSWNTVVSRDIQFFQTYLP